MNKKLDELISTQAVTSKNLEALNTNMTSRLAGIGTVAGIVKDLSKFKREFEREQYSNQVRLEMEFFSFSSVT